MSKSNYLGVFIPKEVMSSSELTCADKIVYGNLYGFKSKCCYESNERMAGKCGMDERTVRRALNKLQKMGLITIKYEKNNTSKRRIFIEQYGCVFKPKKSSFPQAYKENNREESKSFPQIGQNVRSEKETGQNVRSIGQIVRSRNRLRPDKMSTKEKKKKNIEKERIEQKPNLDASAACRFNAAAEAPPRRADFKTQEEFEAAFEAWCLIPVF